ncbi:Rho GTPase-activating Rho GTPase activation protein [Tubulinosema ratisbonensis]|uniref:Rho GTPase-activating Rho GTPase activation protein n=1 Tax=Tubulinosema ratisbonensis TaxID=291195 RepID=A0A437AMH7_9MICR|nr:Rho GTPase-activating Rho GTPase activation protein [Tubulinosema ratisbonensis]
MNDKIIQDFLSTKIDSINDYSEEEVAQIKKEFFDKNKDVITSELTFREREYTLEGKKFSLCCSAPEIALADDTTLSETRFKYGKNTHRVPVEFVVLMESIIRKNEREQGVFRKPANSKKKKECEELFFSSVKGRFDMEQLIKELDQFDAIVLSSIFKQLFSRSYVSIFPTSFFKIIKKVMVMDDLENKFIITKYLIYSVPPINRALLESTLSFLILIHDIDSDRGLDYEGHLDIKGYGTIIMPNLFLGFEKNVTFRDLADLADYAGYLMIHIKELLDIKTEKLNRPHMSH